MGIERRLSKIENEINAGRTKIDLQDGESILLSSDELLRIHAEAIEYAAEARDWSELSDLTRKIANEAKDGQDQIIRARVMLGKEDDPEKTEVIP